MPWIPPLDEAAAPEAARATADAHAATGGRMTNMKWTLAHAPAALDALLRVVSAPRPRSCRSSASAARTCSATRSRVQNDCLICSTFFRRLLIDDGEDPDELALDELDALIVDFGRLLATDPHAVEPELRARLDAHFDAAEIVLLTAFGAIMVATNVVNDALGVPLDGYLEPYRGAPA